MSASPTTASAADAEMEEAYLEYRRACYNIIYRHARERGLLDKLAAPKTLDEIIAEMGFLPERKPTLELFLRALERFGVVATTDGAPVRYTITPSFSEKDIKFNNDLIARAIGVHKVENLIHGQSYAGIIDTLYKHDNPVAADFVASNIELWNEFLQEPFYRHGRDRAIASVTKPGGHVLDLACGPGFGLVDIGRIVGEQGVVVGLERSRDFVCEAVKRVADQPHIRVTQGNLDDGFPHLRDSFFDGAIIVGAYHFLKQRPVLFEQTARVLKPGGKFCVAYVYTQSGAYDQEIMDLRFSLREPPVYSVNSAELIDLAKQYGFTLVDKATMGCMESFVLEKQG